ncbi:hypothetical protein CRUP_001223 [Coryphaenoides rupestris]|nr:hypothetical protein CRUP_001223 [Coryphaenoides rupestris]
MPCMPKMADCGGLMMGVPNSEPNTPPLLMVNVPPSMSSTASCALMVLSMSAKFMVSTLRITGTTNSPALTDGWSARAYAEAFTKADMKPSLCRRWLTGSLTEFEERHPTLHPPAVLHQQLLDHAGRGGRDLHRGGGGVNGQTWWREIRDASRDTDSMTREESLC